jgi:hypothetical protein
MNRGTHEPTDAELNAFLNSLGVLAREGQFSLDLRVMLGWTPEEVERFGRNMDLPEEADPFAYP